MGGVRGSSIASVQEEKGRQLVQREKAVARRVEEQRPHCTRGEKGRRRARREQGWRRRMRRSGGGSSYFKKNIKLSLIYSIAT